MQYLRDSGFILKRVNFADADRYVTLFCKNHGKIEVVARGVRKINSKRASSIETLNLIDFQAVKSSKNFVLTEVKLIDSFSNLKKDLRGIQKIFIISEIINSLMPMGQKHEDVFHLIYKALLHIPKDKRSVTYFQAKLLSILGFWDPRTSFKNEDHVMRVVEQVIERKLKTPSVF